MEEMERKQATLYFIGKLQCTSVIDYKQPK